MIQQLQAVPAHKQEIELCHCGMEAINKETDIRRILLYLTLKVLIPILQIQSTVYHEYNE